tara:strand:- start:309 stop:1541 length:1233 start_codon:yes stop_codon:yes gene_type:complete
LNLIYVILIIFLTGCSNSSFTENEVIGTDRAENLVLSTIISDTTFKDLQTIIDQEKDGFIINLQNGYNYVFTDTLDLRNYKDGTINCNGATISRPNSDVISTTLSTDYNGGSMITVENIPDAFEVGSKIVLAKGQSQDDLSSYSLVITNITNNKIYMSDSFNESFPSGSHVIKNYKLISGLSSHIVGSSNPNITIKNCFFDGNARNNNMNYSWTLGGSIHLMGGKTSVIKDNYFYDQPNETIIGHGFKILDNYFKDLNGSAVHMSVHDNTKELNAESVIQENIIINMNQISKGINGHSEGAITFSWGPGNLKILNNTFISKSGNYGVMGFFFSSPTNGAENLTFSNNYAENFEYIIKVNENFGEPMRGFNITNNTFKDCGLNHLWFSQAAEFILVENNDLIGNTTLTTNR